MFHLQCKIGQQCLQNTKKVHVLPVCFGKPIRGHPVRNRREQRFCLFYSPDWLYSPPALRFFFSLLTCQIKCHDKPAWTVSGCPCLVHALRIVGGSQDTHTWPPYAAGSPHCYTDSWAYQAFPPNLPLSQTWMVKRDSLSSQPCMVSPLYSGSTHTLGPSTSFQNPQAEFAQHSIVGITQAALHCHPANLYSSVRGRWPGTEPFNYPVTVPV